MKHIVPWLFSVATLIVLVVPPGSLAASQGPADPGSAEALNSHRVYLPLIGKDMPPFPNTVYVPAGEFRMGCDPAHNGGYSCYSSELPLHAVFVDAYYIDKTEVTNAQYAQCVAAGGCTTPGFSSPHTRPSYHDNAIYDHYPVVYVSWRQAAACCAWVGKRLPTEAEWEKAARGANDTRAYPWGDSAPACALVNGHVYGDCVGDTSPIGSHPAGASP